MIHSYFQAYFLVALFLIKLLKTRHIRVKVHPIFYFFANRSYLFMSFLLSEFPDVKVSVSPGLKLWRNGEKEAQITCSSGAHTDRLIFYVDQGTLGTLSSFEKKCEPNVKQCVSRLHINSSSFKNYSFVNVACNARRNSRCTFKELKFKLDGKYQGKSLFRSKIHCHINIAKQKFIRIRTLTLWLHSTFCSTP